MSFTYTFQLRGLTFNVRDGHVFLDDTKISYRDLFLFGAGKIDLAPKPTIVDVVVDASGASGFDTNGGDFDILREALAAADLTDTLASRGVDLTVFAPTDDAFIQLARDLGATIADGDEQGAFDAIVATLTTLGGGDPIPLLKDILLYHVAQDGRTLKELQADGTITTENGATLDVRGVDLVDAEPDVTNSKVAIPDIDAANGTIQAIDRVLLPIDLPGNDLPNIVDIAASNPNFDILVKALGAAGLADTIRGLSDITVFAPTDAAFAQLATDLGFSGDAGDAGDAGDDDAVFGFLVDALTELGSGDPIPVLTDILLYHVSAGAKSAEAIATIGTIETQLSGVTIEAAGAVLQDQEPDIDDPEIVIPDIQAGNGAIQAIDRVLLPIDIPGNTAGEVIEGTNGRDKLMGTTGDDEISGNRGNDRIDGDDGDDIINGGGGRDLLIGGAGDDHLTGGRGADRFDFRDLEGDDAVKDFSLFDRLVFSDEDFANVHEVRAAATVEGDDLVIETADGSVTLEDTYLFQLNSYSVLIA